MKSWTLLAFASERGKMKVGTFTNKETNEPFKSCAFIDAKDNICLVGFAKKLGVLTPSQISAQKAELRVAEDENGRFWLYKGGSNEWEDVDL